MYFSRDEIKADLLDNYDEIVGAVYPEDQLQEHIDGYVPLYNNAIIADWQEMPSDFDNAWQDLGADPDKGIVSLMQHDLFAYYENLTNRVWAEIKAEKAGE